MYVQLVIIYLYRSLFFSFFSWDITVLYQPPEKIDKVMRGPFYMDSLKAKEFGVIDKVF